MCVYDSAIMQARVALMRGHPCSSEGRGLSCIGWGQIRSGTQGARSVYV